MLPTLSPLPPPPPPPCQLTNTSRESQQMRACNLSQAVLFSRLQDLDAGQVGGANSASDTTNFLNPCPSSSSAAPTPPTTPRAARRPIVRNRARHRRGRKSNRHLPEVIPRIHPRITRNTPYPSAISISGDLERPYHNSPLPTTPPLLSIPPFQHLHEVEVIPHPTLRDLPPRALRERPDDPPRIATHPREGRDYRVGGEDCPILDDAAVVYFGPGRQDAVRTDPHARSDGDGHDDRAAPNAGVRPDGEGEGLLVLARRRRRRRR